MQQSEHPSNFDVNQLQELVSLMSQIVLGLGGAPVKNPCSNDVDYLRLLIFELQWQIANLPCESSLKCLLCSAVTFRSPMSVESLLSALKEFFEDGYDWKFTVHDPKD